MTPPGLLYRGIKWFLVAAVLLLALNELALSPVLPIPTVMFLALFIASAQAWTEVRRAEGKEPIPPMLMLALGVAGLAFWIPVWWMRRDSAIPMDPRTFAGLIAVPGLLFVAGVWTIVRRKAIRRGGGAPPA